MPAVAPVPPQILSPAEPVNVSALAERSLMVSPVATPEALYPPEADRPNRITKGGVAGLNGPIRAWD